MKSFQLFAIAVCVAGGVWHFATRASSSITPPPPPPTAVLPPPIKEEVTRAEPRPLIDVPAPEIRLTIGRVIYDVVVLNFAETAVSVMHRDGKQIIPYDQFPSEYRQTLVEGKPKPKVPDTKDEARKAALAREKEQKNLEKARMAREAARDNQVNEDRAANNVERDLSTHEGIARSHAYQFFKSKYDPTGSGTAYITNLNIDTGAAEAVSGWEGRYRVSGSASFRLYESAGGSMNQGSRKFEITTERKGNDCRVIDFTLK